MMKELYKRTCYLHIGTTKTGTTAIQSTLDLNRGLLNKKNFFMISNEIRGGNSDYKLSISFRNFYKEPVVCEQLNNLGIYDLKEKNCFSENLKKLYNERIYENPSQNLIITSEQFCFDIIEDPGSLSRCSEFLKSLHFDVVVVVYLRNQFDWILSDYIQNIKDGGLDNLRRYLLYNLVRKPNIYDLYKLISFLQSKSIRLIVRPYEKSLLYRKDLILDFFKNVLGFEESILDQVKMPLQSDSNVSRPDKREIERILEINRAYYAKHSRKISRNESKKLLKIKSAMPLNGSRYTHSNDIQLRLPEKYKLAILSIYSRGNRKLRSKFPYLLNLETSTHHPLLLFRSHLYLKIEYILVVLKRELFCTFRKLSNHLRV